MRKPHKTVLVASAVAAMLLAGAAAAEDKEMPKGKDKQGASVNCAGVNECKGHGECAGPGHGCAGANECKGKGWIEVKSEAECTRRGGKVLGKG